MEERTIMELTSREMLIIKEALNIMYKDEKNNIEKWKVLEFRNLFIKQALEVLKLKEKIEKIQLKKGK